MSSYEKSAMDVLNKLYSTVSSTVSQLSTVLPGNPVTREYEATNHIASAGPGLLWKIFSGYKKSTNQEASIFLLEKKQLERLPKPDRDAVLETLRKSISQLARLRHPQILVVQHTLEESRDSLAFATEPVFASLANILGKIDNIPVPVPLTIDNFKLYEVEIKYGLMQLAEGLTFLHNDVKLLHRNLCPQNIIMNKEGVWKIFGFDFSVLCISGAEPQVRWPMLEYAIDVHAFAQPDLDFLAPESGISGTLLASSDIFSFGMLIYSLFNKGKSLNPCNANWSTYSQNITKMKRLSNSDLLSIPQEMREIVKMMLNFAPELRPELHDFLKCDFFEDVGVKALSYLDSLFQWDNLQKSQFYKGLPTILEKLPHRVCLFRIIPCLAKEFVNPTMVPFILPSVFSIAEKCSKEEFTLSVLPHLRPVLKMQEPVQIMLICMQKMELLLKLTPADDVKSDVLPILFRSIECNSQQLQELCLSVIPTFATLIDYPAMKNALIPRIKKLTLNTQYTSVRVNCLVCIGNLMEYLDKWLILDDVIPFLPQIQSREPAVLMSIVGIYKMVLSHKKITIPKEVMAAQVLPFLMPLSIENSLSLNQFNAVIAIIKEMVTLVENEQRVKLEQLSSVQERQKSFEFTSTNLSNGVDSTVSTLKHGNDLQDLFGFHSSDKRVPVQENKPLNLREKQSLAKQSELQQRLQIEPVITPVPVAKSQQKSTTKDLTASLIDSNLKEMNILSGPKPNTMKSFQSIPTASNFNSMPFNSSTYPVNAFSTLPSASHVNTTIPAAKIPLSSTSANFTPNSSGLSPAAFFSSSLLGNSSLNPNVQSKQHSKQLTSSEINDFLN